MGFSHLLQYPTLPLLVKDQVRIRGNFALGMEQHEEMNMNKYI
jgi:hypothetical protein